MPPQPRPPRVAGNTIPPSPALRPSGLQTWERPSCSCVKRPRAQCATVSFCGTRKPGQSRLPSVPPFPIKGLNQQSIRLLPAQMFWGSGKGTRGHHMQVGDLGCCLAPTLGCLHCRPDLKQVPGWYSPAWLAYLAPLKMKRQRRKIVVRSLQRRFGQRGPINAVVSKD